MSLVAIACSALLAACARTEPESQAASSTIDSTEIVLFAPGGHLHVGKDQPIAVTIHTGATRTPLASDTVTVVLALPGPPREATEARLPRTGDGRFAGHISVPAEGEWSADVIFAGPLGTSSIRLRPPLSVHKDG
jgi:hypothetical protein